MRFLKFKKDQKKIFGLIRKNKILFTISCFIDLGFIIAFLVACWQIVYKQIFQILSRISELMKNLQNLALEEQAAAYEAFAANIEFLGLYSNLIRWLLIFIGVIFLLWIVFQGVNFFLSAKIIDKKTSFWKYIGKFSLFSLFFETLVVLSFWLTVYLSILNSKMVIPIFTQGVINIILIILLVPIHYFCLISLVRIRKKKIIAAFLDTFRVGVKKILRVLFAYFLVILKLGICLLVLFLLSNFNIVLFYLVFLLLFIPIISFSRMMFFYFIEKIK